MNEVSKDTLMSNLQQRMDKCTTEQFWAVAAMTALYAALISHASALPWGIPKMSRCRRPKCCSILCRILCDTSPQGVYSYRKDFAELLKIVRQRRNS